MSGISEEKWKKALCSILKDLSEEDYNELLELLPKILKTKRKSRVEMPQVIIQHYGLEGSISAIAEAMDEIPRRDPRVQSLLRPFVEQNHNKENEGQKRRRDPDEDTSLAADHQMSSTPLTKKKPQTAACSLKRSIRSLKLSSEPVDKFVITGRVVRKSGLNSYRTKDDVKKLYFHIAVADEEDSVRMMVYGAERYDEIKENSSYLFEKLMKEDFRVKVTQRSVVAKTKSVQVPESVLIKAQKLITPDSPLCSTDEARSADGMLSVRGRVTQINPVKDKRRDFELTDQTGSIRIFMWDEKTQACDQLTDGDVVKVTHLKRKKYFSDMSLNSTGFTRILKIQSVGVQTRSVEIEGIIKADEKTTSLKVSFDDQMPTVVIDSPLLAQAFGLKLEGAWIEKLLDAMPLWAEAEIHGNRIKKISAVQEM